MSSVCYRIHCGDLKKKSTGIGKRSETIKRGTEFIHIKGLTHRLCSTPCLLVNELMQTMLITYSSFVL